MTCLVLQLWCGWASGQLDPGLSGPRTWLSQFASICSILAAAILPASKSTPPGLHAVRLACMLQSQVPGGQGRRDAVSSSLAVGPWVSSVPFPCLSSPPPKIKELGWEV